MLSAIGLPHLLWRRLTTWNDSFVIFAAGLEERELSPKSATRRSCFMTYMTLILWKFQVRGSWQIWDESIIGTVFLWLHDFTIDSHKNVKQWLLPFGDKCPENNYGEKKNANDEQTFIMIWWQIACFFLAIDYKNLITQVTFLISLNFCPMLDLGLHLHSTAKLKKIMYICTMKLSLILPYIF